MHYSIIALMRGSHGLSARRAWRTLSSRPEGPQPRSLLYQHIAEAYSAPCSFKMFNLMWWLFCKTASSNAWYMNDRRHVLGNLTTQTDVLGTQLILISTQMPSADFDIGPRRVETWIASFSGREGLMKWTDFRANTTWDIFMRYYESIWRSGHGCERNNMRSWTVVRIGCRNRSFGLNLGWNVRFFARFGRFFCRIWGYQWLKKLFR